MQRVEPGVTLDHLDKATEPKGSVGQSRDKDSSRILFKALWSVIEFRMVQCGFGFSLLFRIQYILVIFGWSWLLVHGRERKRGDWSWLKHCIFVYLFFLRTQVTSYFVLSSLVSMSKHPLKQSENNAQESNLGCLLKVWLFCSQRCYTNHSHGGWDWRIWIFNKHLKRFCCSLQFVDWMCHWLQNQNKSSNIYCHHLTNCSSCLLQLIFLET